MPVLKPRSRHALPIAVSFVLLALLHLAGCGSSLGTNGPPAGPIAVGPDGAQPGVDTRIAQNAQPGIDGTGKQPGIGGTGQIAGTPGIGGTGIIGTVTGFGSIFVNGFEVDYAPGMAVETKDGSVRPDALRIGQVVEVEAEGSGTRLGAHRIAVRHEVAGPIQGIDHVRRTVFVFGQQVHIPSGVIAAANGNRVVSIHDLAVGDHIDVSGLRRANGVIAASRIDKTSPGTAAVLRGRVTSSGPSGFSVNGAAIDAPAGVRPAALASGQVVRIVGAAAGAKLRARHIELAPARPFAGRVRRLSVEGYVTRAISGGVAVDGVPITRLPASASIQAGKRVILDGPVEPRGGFAPERVRAPRANLRFPVEPRPAPGQGQAPRQGAPSAPQPPVFRQPELPRPPVIRPAPRAPRR